MVTTVPSVTRLIRRTMASGTSKRRAVIKATGIPRVQGNHRVGRLAVKLGGKDLSHPAHQPGRRDKVGDVEEAPGQDPLRGRELAAQLLRDRGDLFPVGRGTYRTPPAAPDGLDAPQTLFGKDVADDGQVFADRGLGRAKPVDEL